MNKPSQADLLGYLLGALDAKEQQQVEAALCQHQDVKLELERLEVQLSKVGSPIDDERPPIGLARRTCEAIATVDAAGGSARPRKSPVMMTPSQSFQAQRTGWSAMDVFVAAAVCILVAMIFLPAIANSRSLADLTACQNNLREIGLGLSAYSDNYSGKLIPIPVSRNLGVAGSYAIQLRDQMLVVDDRYFFCPGYEREDGLQKRIPTQQELAAAQGLPLRQLQLQAGGDYAYTLGTCIDGRYCSPELCNASYQVILADAPAAAEPAYRSMNHGGRGQNVLLGDFATKFILNCMVSPGDNIYQNHNGQIAPGVSPNDSVLGSSATSPFVPFP